MPALNAKFVDVVKLGGEPLKVKVELPRLIVLMFELEELRVDAVTVKLLVLNVPSDMVKVFVTVSPVV